MKNHDLSLVALHRREEVLRRIRVIERFIEQPGEAAAKLAGEELGMSSRSIYQLAEAWKASGRPEDVRTAQKPRKPKPYMHEKFRNLIREVIAEHPDRTAYALTPVVQQECRNRSLSPPGTHTIRRVINLERTGSLSPMTSAAGADIVVTFTALDLPVAMATGENIKPLAAMVITTEKKPHLVGLALSVGDFEASIAASAILDALLNGTKSEQIALKIGLDDYAGDDWEAILKILKDAGLPRIGVTRRVHPNWSDATSLLGRRPVGVGLLPGLVMAPTKERRTKLKNEETPFSLHQAEEFMRSRLMRGDSPNPFQSLSSNQAQKLAHGLIGVLNPN